MANWGHFGDVVRKDVEFIKVGLNRGIRWANDAFRIPQVSKTVDDLLWLRNIEDPQAVNLPTPSPPQPSYPGFAFCALFFRLTMFSILPRESIWLLSLGI